MSTVSAETLNEHAVRRHPAQFALLASLGALPFIACAALNIAGVSALPLLGSVPHVAATYGVVIAAFMAGVHWGTYLYNERGAPVNLFYTSNALAVFVWLVYLLGGVSITLMALAAAFTFLLAIDSGLYRRGLITGGYYRVRCMVTLIVVASLLGTLA